MKPSLKAIIFFSPTPFSPLRIVINGYVILHTHANTNFSPPCIFKSFRHQTFSRKLCPQRGSIIDCFPYSYCCSWESGFTEVERQRHVVLYETSAKIWRSKWLN